MNTKKSAALAATIAVAAALALITAAMFSGILPTTTSSQIGTVVSTTSSNSLPTTSQQSTNLASTQSQTQSTTQSSTQSTTQTSSQEGTLSILLTDPPTVPAGVTKVYISYANLAVHVSGMANSSGWTTVQASGSIELLGTVNFSKTISSARIEPGTYNLIRFNVTAAEVTYYAQNYSAFVQTTELTVPIVGDVGVTASTPCAAIIDISPTVINTGTQSSPEFIITSVASAYPVPSSAVTVQQEQMGSVMSLNAMSWWQAIASQTTAHLSIGSASLNSTYLNLKVTNTGGGSTVLHLVTITPVLNATAAGSQGVLPTALGQAAIFVVLGNGSLVQVQVFMNAMMGSTSASAISASLFAQVGLKLPPGATATLTHLRGTILLGFTGMAIETPVGSVLNGHQYLVTVIGEQASTSMIVTAS
ncbi:MAG: DUF4382 domain-containing protein [Thaumarchaeota archaeon]|nr:DUF4382 domain-containing protein [Nitrososphaerota archaeon]